MTDTPDLGTPPPPPGRLHHLDVIRGVAMLGILPVNLWFFAYPMETAMGLEQTVLDGTADGVAVGVVQALFQYKFITIFSFLFGVGIALIHDGCRATGRPFAPRMVRRLLVLLALGLLHAVFLWFGDIVAIYGAIGLFVCVLAGQSARVQAILGGALVLLPCGILLLLLLGALASGGQFDGAGGDALDPSLAQGPWQDYARALVEVHDRPSTAFETEVFLHGSFARISLLRFLNWAYSVVAAYLCFYAWRIAGLMCLGMAAIRQDWFGDPRTDPRPLRRILLGGLVVGVPLHVLALALSRPGGATLDAARGSILYVGSLGLSAAYVAGLALLTARVGVTSFLRPLAAVGRTAFSNYVLQSVVCVTLFYGHGLGWFDSRTPAELWPIALGIWAVELVVSTLWLVPFRMGPLEWFWRSLAEGELQPLRARPAQTARER